MWGAWGAKGHSASKRRRTELPLLQPRLHFGQLAGQSQTFRPKASFVVFCSAKSFGDWWRAVLAFGSVRFVNGKVCR